MKTKPESKIKISVKIRKKTLLDINEMTGRFGFRRDAHINTRLPDYVAALRKARPAARVMAALEPDTLIQVVFTIDREHAKNIDRLCAEKRWPRDLFMEVVLNDLIINLDQAYERLYGDKPSQDIFNEVQEKYAKWLDSRP